MKHVPVACFSAAVETRSQVPVPNDAILSRTGQAAAEVIKLTLKAMDHSLHAPTDTNQAA